jgi:ABC-type polysaccharide/polyol phosphate export permease
MTGVIEGYRAAVLGLPWDWTGLALSALSGLALAALGAWQFRRMERTFADVI